MTNGDPVSAMDWGSQKQEAVCRPSSICFPSQNDKQQHQQPDCRNRGEKNYVATQSRPKSRVSAVLTSQARTSSSKKKGLSPKILILSRRLRSPIELLTDSCCTARLLTDNFRSTEPAGHTSKTNSRRLVRRVARSLITGPPTLSTRSLAPPSQARMHNATGLQFFFFLGV